MRPEKNGRLFCGATGARSQGGRRCRAHAIHALMTVFVMLAAARAMAVEHPGVVPKDAECTSCHVKKISGVSVHSAMAISCTVCHLARTQGDMTTVNLVMPKTEICFACHEKAASLQQHSPSTKGPCLHCHDAHSSERRMLLREAGGPPLSALKDKEKNPS